MNKKANKTSTPKAETPSTSPVPTVSSTPDTQDISSIFASNLKTLLTHYSLSQKELSEKTGFAESTITSYLKKQIPNTLFLLQLKKHFNLSIDDLLTKQLYLSDHHSEQYSAPQTDDLNVKELNDCRKYCHPYYIYYLNTGNYKGHDYNSASESLCYGVLYIYETPSPFGRPHFNCIAALKMESLDKAEALKTQLEEYDASHNIQKAVTSFYVGNQGCIYTGELEFAQEHVFFSLDCDQRDKALAIFHRPRSNKPFYYGGLGTINSLSRGREPMPCIQFLGLSRSKLQFSEEEIHHALLLGYPHVKAPDESEAMIRLFKTLYMSPSSITEELSEFNKQLTIRGNLERYIKTAVVRNIERYAKISNRDDDVWYHMVKESTPDTFY